MKPSKSADSLDSGIYSRQKSYDSMDSLDSADGNNYSSEPNNHHAKNSKTTSFKSSDYDDFFTECEQVENSITPQTPDGELTSDESNWLVNAGLGSILANQEQEKMSRSSSLDENDELGDEEHISAEVMISTLTHQQRQAVLRRVNSFNVNEMSPSKRVSIEDIAKIFQMKSSSDSSDDSSTVPSSPSVEKITDFSSETTKKPAKKNPKKSLSLPRDTDSSALGKIPKKKLQHSVSIESTSSSVRRYSEASSIKKRVDVEPSVATARSSSLSNKKHLGVVAKQGGSPFGRKFKNRGVIADSSLKNVSILNFTPRKEQKCTTKAQEGQLSYNKLVCKDDLPELRTKDDMLGITYIRDLHLKDIRKLQRVAWIELANLFDYYRVNIKERKSDKSKLKDKSVFGCSLTSLVKRDRQLTGDARMKVPRVVDHLLEYLESDDCLKVEGLLRKSGSQSRQRNIVEELDRTLSQPCDNIVDLSSCQPHDIAALLKQLLRQLPNPLLTNKFIDTFQQVEKIPDRLVQVQVLNLLVILMNSTHRSVLYRLLTYLQLVVSNEQYNKMSLTNVSMIIAPNLFVPKSSAKARKAKQRDVKQAANLSNIIRMLIKYHKELWTVPSALLKQVRKMNDEAKDTKLSQFNKNQIGKFMSNFKTPKEPKEITHIEFSKGGVDYTKKVVKIHASEELALKLPITQITVKIQANLLVKDVIQQFKLKIEKANTKHRISEECHFLYEVGGNLQLRRLSSNASIYGIQNINPHTRFELRCERRR